MKLQNIIHVLGKITVDTEGLRKTKKLTPADLVILEQRLFDVQNELEHAPGKKRNRDIATLNDIRNVLLDELEINEARPDMRWPAVERMRGRISGGG